MRCVLTFTAVLQSATGRQSLRRSAPPTTSSFLSSVISSAKDARADGSRASVAPVKASDVQDLFYEVREQG
ncbi:unnamed protein product [Pylaiella littoralis]